MPYKRIVRERICAGYEAFPRGDCALLEERFSDVAVEVSETCKKKKNQSKDSCEYFVS